MMFSISDAGLLLGGSRSSFANGKRVISAKDGQDSLPLVLVDPGDPLYLSSGYYQMANDSGSTPVTGSKVIEEYLASYRAVKTIVGSGYLVRCAITSATTTAYNAKISITVDGVDICNSAKSTTSLSYVQVLKALGEVDTSYGKYGNYSSNQTTGIVPRVKDDPYIIVRFENQLDLDIACGSGQTFIYRAILD